MKTIYPSPGFSFYNCCFHNNVGFSVSGSGNIYTNPRFKAGSSTYELDDYYPSPCINAGTSVQFQYSGDYDGTPRRLPLNGNYDIGAQEAAQ
jgi:hypothetical protein